MVDLKPQESLPTAAGLEYKTLVGEIEAPMLNLCRQLQPLLREGRYGFIAGDDTSGRLPTLVVKKFADHVLNKEGKSKIPVIFLQAGTSIHEEDLEKQVQARVLPITAKIDVRRGLVVTEYIQSGRSISRLGRIFENHGITFDVATLNKETLLPIFVPDRLLLPVGTNVIVGEDGHSIIDKIWNRPKLTGLERARLFHNGGLPVRLLRPRSPLIAQAREDVNLLGAKIIKQLETEKAA